MFRINPLDFKKGENNIEARWYLILLGKSAHPRAHLQKQKTGKVFQTPPLRQSLFRWPSDNIHMDYGPNSSSKKRSAMNAPLTKVAFSLSN